VKTMVAAENSRTPLNEVNSVETFYGYVDSFLDIMYSHTFVVPETYPKRVRSRPWSSLIYQASSIWKVRVEGPRIRNIPKTTS